MHYSSSLSEEATLVSTPELESEVYQTFAFQSSSQWGGGDLSLLIELL